ncbi:hypothetical protein K439DRAFT_1271187, partial [Ramaria rubella]
LKESDLDKVKMLALRLDANMSRSSTMKFGQAYKEKISLDSFYLMHKRVAILSSIIPQIHDCCINTCCAYTGDYTPLEQCLFCSEPRFDNEDKSHPCAQYEYLPLIPRLQGYYFSPDMINLLSYRASRTPVPGEYTDVFDGSHYKQLTSTHITVKNIEYEDYLFQDHHDITLGLLSDGFQVF